MRDERNGTYVLSRKNLGPLDEVGSGFVDELMVFDDVLGESRLLCVESRVFLRAGDCFLDMVDAFFSCVGVGTGSAFSTVNGPIGVVSRSMRHGCQLSLNSTGSNEAPLFLKKFCSITELPCRSAGREAPWKLCRCCRKLSSEV